MNHNEIDNICRSYGIEDYIINNNGSIDVYNSVYLSHLSLFKLPLEFNKVDGDFLCIGSGLVTLKGGPIEVTGDFCCSSNVLTSLEGAPVYVGADFNCSFNKLDSIKYAPKKVGGSFYCSGNLKELNYESYINSVNRLEKIKKL